MPAYQLQIKQVVDYPRCRIYRQFVHRLMADRSIRTSGGSGLFYFTVLCSYANFRTSYRRIDGISYTTVHAVDGTAWYKQYAADAVEKSPYMAPDGSIAYHESIVKKLPPTPKRKDKL